MTYLKPILIFIIGCLIITKLPYSIDSTLYLIICGCWLLATMLSVVKSFINTTGRDNKWKKADTRNYTIEFENIYKHIKSNYKKEIESLRLNTIIHLIIPSIVLFIDGIISLYVILLIGGKLGALVGSLVFAPALGFFIRIYNKYNKKYQNSYKELIVNNFIKAINPSLTYNSGPNKKLEVFFKDAQFRNIKYSKYASNDYISGQISNVLFEWSDVILSSDVYYCTFAHSNLSKEAQYEIRIKNNRNVIIPNHNLVSLDSNEFEKCFDVFSASQIFVMEILTHDIMEEMVTFHNNTKINFEIVIKGKHIYIRYDIGDIFEGSILRKSTSKQSLWICYSTLKFAINLALKINKILESKEDIL